MNELIAAARRYLLAVQDERTNLHDKGLREETGCAERDLSDILKRLA